MATVSQGKAMTLSELRVFELKQELEKRGLDKSGIKLALVERLEGALREEGHDPKTYKFMVSDYGKPTTPLKNSSSEVSVKEASAEQVTEHANGDNEMESKSDSMECVGFDDLVAGYTNNDEQEAKHDVLVAVTASSEEIKVEEVESKQERIAGQDQDESEINDEKGRLDEIVNEATGLKMENTNVLEEGAVKEMMEEINYEDEEMPDASKLLDESAEGKSKKTESESAEEIDENKRSEENSGKGDIEREKSNAFASTAETVASTPAERIENTVSTAATSIIKKADNSLWIKGISSNTKAADLKALFSKFGRVLTAKIFTRRQQPSNSCFGFVTMVDAVTADLCIQKLHKTTVKGRLITVERADRCNMPIVKSTPKKTTSSTMGDVKSGKSTSIDISSKSSDEKKSSSKISEKPKKEMDVADKVKSTTTTGDKGGSSTGTEKQKTVKAASESKKSPVKAPSDSTTQSKFPSVSSSKRLNVTRVQPRFRISRRIDRVDRVSSTLRRSYSTRKPSYSSAASRRTLGIRSFSSRFSHGSISHGISRREVSSRRVEPPASWEKREMMEMLRKKEEEHRLKEQELRLQRERERLKFERERFERERLELQQLRQIAALTTPVQSLMPAPAAPQPRRSHEYGEVDSARYKSEKKLKRSEYSRRSGERSSSSHRAVSTRSAVSDRRESRSSRHVSSSHSSRAASDRARDRSRDRSRHTTREYGSSNTVRESAHHYGRDGHSYSRTGDPSLSNSFGRESYRPDSTSYSSHRSSDSAYASRDLGNYNPSSTYSRDVAPSYSKDAGYGGSSRSLGSGGNSWSVGGSSSAYVSSSRDYDSGAWMSGISASQSHGSHMGGGNWSTSRDDHWSGSSMGDTHGHVPSYDKYDKYDSYDKYSRRY